MGAGAGYTIEVQNCKFNSIDSFTPVAISEGLLEIDCQINATGDIRGESYYYGCPWIVDVPMVITHIDLNYGELFDGYKVDRDMLTPEAAIRILNEYNAKFDADAEDITDIYFDTDFTSLLTIDDFNYDIIKSSILNSYFSIEGEASLGGGWVHSTFNGEFTITVEQSFYDESYTIELPDKFIVDYLDRAVMGENVLYDVVFNGDVIASYGYGEEDEAIEALVQEIDKAIAEGGLESVDFSDCYVEQGEDILLNGIGESDVDFGNAYKVYEADYEDFVEDSDL